jgi:anti-sigma factor RsiW
MSSNELHITRANYEEFFLLYVDGELTAAQSDAVEAFAAQHPDLQEELDLLLTTRLDAEPVFFNKESLMADSMKHTSIDESLLLYVDDELKGEEKAAVEKQLEHDATYQYQHALLRKTKLTAEVIPYPDKTELYRKEERAVRPIVWFRVAAAVFVVMAAGYMWSLTDKVTPATDVARQTPATKKVTTPSVEQEPAVITQPSATEEVAVINTPSTTDVTETVANNRPVEAIASHTSVNTIVTTTDSRTEKAEVKSTIVNTTEETQVIARVETPQQIINNQSVTTAQPTAYNKQIDADALTAASTAVAIETTNNKRGSVKGFLRKATRFIERRTGVDATNENDELLIGALSINLK